MAATGTPTPNLGLRRAQGTDPASVDDINYNSELLDTKLGAVGATSVQGQIDALSASTAQTFGSVQDGLAIVSNGNTHVAIPAGYWVYVKGHGTLSEGLYKNTSGATIAANATLSTSNLTADPDGGLNSVYDALNSNMLNLFSKFPAALISNADIDTILDSGLYPMGSNNAHSPTGDNNSNWASMIVIMNGSKDTGGQLFLGRTGLFYRTMVSSTWSAWNNVTLSN